MSEDAVRILLAEPDATTRLGLRDQVMLVFFYDTGTRVQEVLNVRICDLKLDSAPKVVLHGKGRKVRTVPLMKDTVQHLSHYMTVFHEGETAASPLPAWDGPNACIPMARSCESGNDLDLCLCRHRIQTPGNCPCVRRYRCTGCCSSQLHRDRWGTVETALWSVRSPLLYRILPLPDNFGRGFGVSWPIYYTEFLWPKPLCYADFFLKLGITKNSV